MPRSTLAPFVVRRILPVLACVVVGCAGPEPVVDEGAAVAAALDTMRTALQSAVVARDAAALAALFADDAVLHEVDGSVVTGRAAIEARIAAVLPGVAGYALTSQRTDVGGDLAVDHQLFQLTLAEGAEPRVLHGNQLVVLRRGPDGSWRVAHTGAWLGASPEPHHH